VSFILSQKARRYKQATGKLKGEVNLYTACPSLICMAINGWDYTWTHVQQPIIIYRIFTGPADPVHVFLSSARTVLKRVYGRCIDILLRQAVQPINNSLREEVKTCVASATVFDKFRTVSSGWNIRNTTKEFWQGVAVRRLAILYSSNRSALFLRSSKDHNLNWLDLSF